jgi:hypothetical protein
MYKAYNNTWEPADTKEERIEGMKKKLREFTEQLAWNREYISRLEIAISQLSEDIDLEVAEVMKHK